MKSQRKGRDTYGKLEIKLTQPLPKKVSQHSVSPTWLQIIARPQEGNTTLDFTFHDLRSQPIAAKGGHSMYYISRHWA